VQAARSDPQAPDLDAIDITIDVTTSQLAPRAARPRVRPMLWVSLSLALIGLGVFAAWMREAAVRAQEDASATLEPGPDLPPSAPVVTESEARAASAPSAEASKAPEPAPPPAEEPATTEAHATPSEPHATPGVADRRGHGRRRPTVTREASPEAAAPRDRPQTEPVSATVTEPAAPPVEPGRRHLLGVDDFERTLQR
jgi:cytoskeletal protein RodZ